jgi:ribonuclease J
MRIPDTSIIEPEQIERLDPSQVCIICTGSQGEPRSALWQMVAGDNRFVKLTDDDVVVFSSHPIPGNEAPVARLRNALARIGVDVIHSGQLDVHTSGHARQGELSVFHHAARPQWFIPVHGEYAHLAAHAKLARELGMPADRVLVCVNGDSVVLDDDGVHRGDPESGREIYVDGSVGAVDDATLRERRILGSSGFVGVIATVDAAARRLVTPPVVTSRGWAIDDQRDDLHATVGAAVTSALENVLAEDGVVVREVLERAARRAAGTTVNECTRRRPMIVPVVHLLDGEPPDQP